MEWQIFGAYVEGWMYLLMVTIEPFKKFDSKQFH